MKFLWFTVVFNGWLNLFTVVYLNHKSCLICYKSSNSCLHTFTNPKKWWKSVQSGESVQSIFGKLKAIELKAIPPITRKHVLKIIPRRLQTMQSNYPANLVFIQDRLEENIFKELPDIWDLYWKHDGTDRKACKNL